MIPKLYIARTPDGTGFPLPSYTSKYHMGLNLAAAIGAPMRISPNERVLIPVGFAIGVPVGFVGQIVSYPQLAEENGLIVSDGPRLVNPADREPIFVLMQNVSSAPQVLHRGDIVAQMIVGPAVQVCWQEVAPHTNEKPSTEEELIVDPGTDETQKNPQDKFKSYRRVQKSIRNRFKSSDEDNGG